MEYPTQRFSLTPAAIALIAIVVVAIGAGAASIYEVGKIRQATADAAQTQLRLQEYLTLVVDQETAVRAVDAMNSATSGGFVAPYSNAARRYPQVISALRIYTRDRELAPAAPAIESADALHAEWIRQVAEPVFASPGSPHNASLERTGKRLVDGIRAEVADALGIAARTVAERRMASQKAVAVTVAVIVFFVLAVGAIALHKESKHSAELQKLLREIADRNKALERSNSALAEFAYVASHDLQEPLRTVASFTQLLQKRYAGKLDSDADEFIAFAVDGAHRMQQLINDILTYSRVTTHGKPLEPVDLSDVAHRAVENLAFTVAERSASVRIGALPRVMGDPVQLAQLLQNLIGNAIKYGGTPPVVSVEAVPSGEGWRIRVADNGIGIAPEYHDRVFRIFQRLHTRAEYSGTGVGLAICKGIVERHGGRIWVESDAGKGATFNFTLQAAPTEMAQPA